MSYLAPLGYVVLAMLFALLLGGLGLLITHWFKPLDLNHDYEDSL